MDNQVVHQSGLTKGLTAVGNAIIVLGVLSVNGFLVSMRASSGAFGIELIATLVWIFWERKVSGRKINVWQAARAGMIALLINLFVAGLIDSTIAVWRYTNISLAMSIYSITLPVVATLTYTFAMNAESESFSSRAREYWVFTILANSITNTFAMDAGVAFFSTFATFLCLLLTDAFRYKFNGSTTKAALLGAFTALKLSLPFAYLTEGRNQPLPTAPFHELTNYSGALPLIPNALVCGLTIYAFFAAAAADRKRFPAEPVPRNEFASSSTVEADAEDAASVNRRAAKTLSERTKIVAAHAEESNNEVKAMVVNTNIDAKKEYSSEALAGVLGMGPWVDAILRK